MSVSTPDSRCCTVTPSEILSAAAVRVRDLAAEASPGVWSATDLTEDGHPGVWWVDCDHTDEEGRLMSTVADCDRSGGDARWIAALSPAIAEPLAEALDVAAGTAREMEEDGREVNQSWAMLDLARALVGSVSEENTHD